MDGAWREVRKSDNAESEIPCVKKGKKQNELLAMVKTVNCTIYPKRNVEKHKIAEFNIEKCMCMGCYAVLFTIDAALLLVDIYGVALMVYAQNRIKILRRAEKDALRVRVIPKENSRTTGTQLKKVQKHKSSDEIYVQ